MNEVLSVFPNQYRKLHTTRSWNFIGLPLTAKRKLKSEGDTIVALLDTGLSYTFQLIFIFLFVLYFLVLYDRLYVIVFHDVGITPEFQSFKDDGFGPPPAKWKGTCHKFVNFSGCNK